MAHLIDITNMILSQNTICFNSSSVDIEKISFPIDNAKFGILNFKAVTSSETNKELEFIFTVDCSGSMSDMCSDRRSKMQHIIHTLKNMIIFLQENSEINVNIIVNSFDKNLYKIVERTRITRDNYRGILEKIEEIHPMGSTNIENALIESSQEINSLKILYPDHIINHIFMTDGQATDGSNDISLLKNIVVQDVTNAFIGFGIEHDSALLNGISSIGKSGYYFIDKLENAGLVYGEILHSIIYKILTDCEIDITNGLIYNFKTNSWVNNLKIDDIVSESDKTYNIISQNPDDVRVTIKGRLDDLVILYPSIKIDDDNLCKHVFRQRTLELMFKVNEYCNKKMELNIDSDEESQLELDLIQLEDTINESESDSSSLKKQLIDFMNEMKQFMIDNNLTDDKFMKNLCDDIYICFRTFDTKYGSMFCNSRQTSQGSQRQYTVSNTNDIELEGTISNSLPNFTPMLRRGFNRIGRRHLNTSIDLDFNDINLPILNHELSQFVDTPYLTPQATQVMRFVSATNNENELLCRTQEI